jgi:UDP-glucose:(heptosyl)LPS alpha-1,3-glucosyltransferase
MHIAIIRRRFNPYGGAERFILRTIKSLGRHQIKTSIIAEDWQDTPPESCTDSCDHIKIDKSTGSRSKQFLNFQNKVAETLKSQSFDIIQSHERLVGADIYRLGDGIHAAWVKRLSSIKPWYAKLWLKIDPFHQLIIKTERLMAKDYQLTFVSNSPMVARELVDWYAVPLERITVIENGIDTSAFQPATPAEKSVAKEKLGLNLDIPTILFVGSGFDRKGAFELTNAMTTLPEFQLVIVGHDKKIKQLKDLVSNLKLEKRIQVVGPQSDVKPYLMASDIFCLPSLYDSLPNALLEAICFGLPVVITEDVGISEKIVKNNAGRISTRDHKSIAEAIKAVWDNHQELSQNALALSKEFDINKATQKWIDLYIKLIQTKAYSKKD